MSNMFTSVFSFLTIIPSGSHTLEDTAKNMHAFPAIGLLMGFVLGIAALGLYYLGVDQIIVAFLLVAATKLVQSESFLHNLIMCFSVCESKSGISPEIIGTFPRIPSNTSPRSSEYPRPAVCTVCMPASDNTAAVFGAFALVAHNTCSNNPESDRIFTVCTAIDSPFTSRFFHI